MSEADVVIVGAGPGGAGLAVLLASRGVDTVLVERQSDFAREFRGEVMMPGGLEALELVGADLAKVPHQMPVRFRGFMNGKNFLDLALDPATLERQPLTVSQPHLLEHLVDLASRHATFRLVRGGSARDLLEENGRVCGVRVRTDAGDEPLRARLVVGADGRASVVRRRGGFLVEERGAPMDIVWCKLPWPGDWSEPQVRGYFGHGHLLIGLPAPDGLLQVAWVILKGTYGELRSRGIEEWVLAMAEHVDDDFGEHLLANAGQLSRPFLLVSETDRVRGWARPGVLVIGDAAHTMSPVGGQGLNVALRDAVEAANQLVPAFKSGADDADLDRAAAGVEPLRAREIDTIQTLAAQPPRVVMGHRFWHAAARWAIARLVATPFGQRRGAPIADVFLRGVTDVTLRV